MWIPLAFNKYQLLRSDAVTPWAVPRDASASGFSDADDTACTEYYESLFLAGQRKDFIHHGVELNGLAGVRVQLEGNRILAMALVDDIKKYLCEKSGDDDPEEACGAWRDRSHKERWEPTGE